MTDDLRELRHDVKRARRALQIAERKLHAAERREETMSSLPSAKEHVDPDQLLAAKLKEDEVRKSQEEAGASLKRKKRSMSVRTVSGGRLSPR